MLKLASSIGLALAAADLKRRVRHWTRQGVLGVIGAVTLVIALCFFLVAAHLYLSGLLNPIASAAIIGGVLLFVALVFFGLASRQFKVHPSASAPAAAQPAGQLGDAVRDGMAKLGAAAGSAESPLRNPVLLAAAFALLVGFLFGRRTKRGDQGRDD